MNMKMMGKDPVYSKSVGIQELVTTQTESTSNIIQLTNFIIRLLVVITFLFTTNTVTHMVSHCQGVITQMITCRYNKL